MVFIGIDLSGPSNIYHTAVSVFEPADNGLVLVEGPEYGPDDYIFELPEVYKDHEIVFGLDAPLSYNPGGGDRPSDKALKAQLRDSGAKAGVMAPTMTRMCYLTLRGIHLAHVLNQNSHVKIVEVHPTASMALQGADQAALANFKASGVMRQKLTWWLSNQGLHDLPSFAETSDHDVASFACALAAWRWTEDKCIWKHPAQLPHFPFDFVC